MIVTGITKDGEQLQFEEWVYDDWRRGMLQDEWLIEQLRRCIRFKYT